MKLNQDAIDHYRTSNLPDLWDRLDTPILHILDEAGENIGNAQVRHLGGNWWLAVDEYDGWQVVPQSAVEMWILEKRS